jgi:hypothetical protein
MPIHVLVHDDAVDIDFTGLDRFEALKGHLRLPVDVITDARVVPQADAKADLGLRIGGTYLPGCVVAGHFTTRSRKGVRQLWDVHRDPEVLLIETTLDRPWRVVLQHPDRERLAWLIAERAHRRRSA